MANQAKEKSKAVDDFEGDLEKLKSSILEFHEKYAVSFDLGHALSRVAEEINNELDD